MSRARNQQLDIGRIDSIEADLATLDASLDDVATTGAYTSLAGTPTFKTVNSSTILGSGDVLTTGRLIKKTRYFVDTALTQLSTAYAWMPQQNKSFTPLRSDTVVIFKYKCLMRGKDAHGIGHMRFYLGGSEQTNMRMGFCCNTDSASPHDYFDFPVFEVASWGAGVAKAGNGWQMREYAAANEVQLGATNHWDGSGTDQSTPVEFTIEEWLMP